MIGFIAFFSLLLTSVIPSQAQADEWETYGTPRTPASTGYTCQIDSECLNYLHNTLLNEQSSESVYQICKEVHKRNKDCCLDPSGCSAPYAEDSNLKENSHSFFQQHGGNVTSCQLNNLSSLMSGLSQVQNSFCSNGKTHCREMCKNKLEDLRRVFRDCFSVEDQYSISHVLEKAKKSSNDPDCYREINKVAEIYKRQSRNQTALFKDHLESQDIVDCAAIGREKAASNLNTLAVNICQQAQQQRQIAEVQQRQEQAIQEAAKPQTGTEFGSGSLSSEPGNNQSRGEIEGSGGLGSEALLGAAAGALALKKSLKGGNKSPSQVGSFESVNTGTTSTGTHSQRLTSQGSTNSSRTSNSRQRTTDRKTVTSATPNTVGTSHLAGNQANTASKPLQLAQAGGSSGCPMRIPKIRSAVVFQSVEAPQIEPMSKQDHPPYDDYDLVRVKHAGILIRLFPHSIRRNKRVAVALHIDNEKFYSRCFHKPFNGEMKQGNEKNCSFTKDDLRKDGYYKFFPLPMLEEIMNRKKKNLPIKVILYPTRYRTNTDCWNTKTVRVNIKQTPGLELALTRIKPGRNCNYQITPLQTMWNFTNSKEIKSYLAAMFPVPWAVIKNLNTHKNQSFIPGNCNNNPALKRKSKTVGLLADINTLERERALGKYSKLLAIVPKEYFIFHKEINPVTKKPPAGLVVLPDWETELWVLGVTLKFGFLGGSWNIALVSDTRKITELYPMK